VPTVDKNQWIRQHVQGLSFADLGGLWGTVNEKVSVALEGGAKEATMIDIAPLDHKLWTDFRTHAAARGLKTWGEKSADAVLPDLAARVGRFEMLHCSGIIYHLPDPYVLVRNCRAVASRFFILTSMYVPETIENDVGKIDLTEGGALFVPALTGRKKEIIAAHFAALKIEVDAINRPMRGPWVRPDGRPSYDPWWWLMTPGVLRAMLTVTGFKVIDEGESWAGRSYSFLCEAV
jgi:hypothetical protein